MSKTLQRYENKSKSQRPRWVHTYQICCLRLCKDTKIKANHNYNLNSYSVVLLSKTLQRYENKSKSQRRSKSDGANPSCLRLCKDTKIKANHNNRLDSYLSNLLSKTLQRYENKSKSQQASAGRQSLYRCLRLCKDTKIKANHNLQNSTFVIP